MFRVLQASYPSILDPKHPDLSAFWTFDNISGTTVYDDSRNSFDGTMVGTPTIGAGKHGNAMTTDRTVPEYMTVNPSAVSDLNVGAVSMWARGASSGVDVNTRCQIVLSKSGVTTGFLSMGTIYHLDGYRGWLYRRWGVGDESQCQYLTNNTFALDADHNFIWESDGTNYSCTVNGISESIYLMAGDAAGDGDWFSDCSGANQLTVQAALDSSPEYYNGQIDTVRIFDRTLSVAEKITLANE